MISFTIPGKITSANRVTRRVGNASLKSASAREDHARIRSLALAASRPANSNDWGVPLFGASVRINAYNSRLDADNLPKTILDGIKGILIENDSPKHLRYLVVHHNKDERGERYIVEVSQYGESW